MTTRYSSLVNVKKNIVQQKERGVESANLNLQNAKKAVDSSYAELTQIQAPQNGKINDFISTRVLLDAQRALIKHNEEWLSYASKEIENAKQDLKGAMIEYEKFKYLEYQELQKELSRKKLKEAKELDEIALVVHTRKSTQKVFS
ncbi:MAG: flagellar FliJ family protein [Campylobacterales bacterium]|nr:flagellar FliJ family protein [Campylobacterales bacterium]